MEFTTRRLWGQCLTRSVENYPPRSGPLPEQQRRLRKEGLLPELVPKGHLFGRSWNHEDSKMTNRDHRVSGARGIMYALQMPPCGPGAFGKQFGDNKIRFSLRSVIVRATSVTKQPSRSMAATTTVSPRRE